MRYLLFVLIVLLGVLGLVGCSGGGGGGNNILPGDTGRLAGDLQVADAPSYDIMVDGQVFETHPGPDGGFEVPGLPPGDHIIAFISDSGMVGAYLPIVIQPGKTTDVGDVVPLPGGQIAGLVMQQGEGGALTPLAGVEVIADPEPIWIEPGPVPLQAMPPREGDALTLRAVTDETGGYRMPAVPEGAYVVTVNVPGLEQGVAFVWVGPGETATADFQLRDVVDPGIGTVNGHVTAALEAGATALAGAIVSIYSDGGWSPVPPGDPIPVPAPLRALSMAPAQAECILPPDYFFREFSTLTDASGAYTLNVPAGHLQISVWAEGYEGAWESITLQADTTLTRDFALKPWTWEPPPPIDGGGDDPVVGTR